MTTSPSPEKIEPIRPRWDGTMTDRERFNRQMHHRPVDRSFHMEFGYWRESYRIWPLFVDHGITDEVKANRFFGFDPYEVHVPLWMHPPFEEKMIRETETTSVYINNDGLLAEVPKDGHETIPHYIEASIKTPDDWAGCKAERFRRDDPARRVDVEALKQAHPADRTYPLGVHCGSMIGKVRDVLTFEGLAYACYDYPEMIEDMVETCCLLIEDYLDQVLPHIDFDLATGWEDICFKSGPIVSVEFFRAVVVPRYQRIRAKLDAAGIDVWHIDCDGDIRPLIPLFLEGGVNCLFPFEVNGSGHPADVLEAYGPEILIMGGVDKMAIKKGGPTIRAYLESLVPWVERGGFIPFCDHRCPPDVPGENYLYYLDLKRESFGG